MKRTLLLLVFLMIAGLCPAQSKDCFLMEAESFQDTGGWVIDQEFMDQMGSPYLLAHGIGKPVKNAKADISLPKTGEWHVYARTWNWVAPWGIEECPGTFKLIVNGVTLDNELGKGKKWGWEYAGSIQVSDKKATLELCDLTGFEGRCDAIVFTRKKDTVLPNGKNDLPAFRKRLLGLPDKAPSAGQYDLVVVGAGTAGMCAAIQAAREGLRVALINNRPVPGGNNSTELHIVASGATNVAPYVKLGNITKEITNVYSKEKKVLDILAEEKTLSYFPNMHVFAAKTVDGRILSVTAKNIVTSEELEFSAPLFADCSGDGNLGFLAGAEFRVGREMRSSTRETLAPDRPDNLVLGATISWSSKAGDEDVPFPVLDWAIQLNEDSCEKVTSGSNWWESGFYHDQVEEAEFIRDYLFRAIYGNWSFLKNKSRDKADYAKRDLNKMTYIAAKRESRRLMGDVFFVQQDIEKEYVKYDDAIVIGTYSIDQHFPTPKNSFYFPGEEFISTMKHYFNDLGVGRKYLRDDQVPPPYRLPYRCLYSVNIDNLFMAGRNVSVSHIALSSTRVQKMTGQMGEVVGEAAAICVKHDCTPRGVYTDHLEELLNAFK